MERAVKKPRVHNDDLEELRERAMRLLNINDAMFDAMAREPGCLREIIEKREKEQEEIEKLKRQAEEDNQAKRHSQEDIEMLKRQLQEENDSKRQALDENEKLKRQAEEENDSKRQALDEIEKLRNRTFKISLRRLLTRPPPMSLKKMGSSSSHTGRSKHFNATAVQNAVPLQKIEQSLYYKDGIDEVSRLLIQFEADKDENETAVFVSHYYTENDVSQHTIAALEDAKSLIQWATRHILKVLHEASLFADRPDHIVIAIGEKNDPIIVVEDKKPFPYIDGDALPGPVLGQVYDYLMEMIFMGHSLPFVVLSTFEASWMFCLKDHSNKFVFCENVLKETQATFFTKNSVRNNNKTPSPLSLKEDQNIDIERSRFAKDFKRQNMLVSQRFMSNELVQMLYTAILIGLGRNSSSPKTELVAKRTCGTHMALKLDKTSYEWGRLDLAVPSKNPIEILTTTTRRPKFKGATNDSYFVIEMIGRGHTSKVFDAVDYKGNRCVIKMYVKHGDNNTVWSKAKFQETGRAACKLEVDRLTTFYKFLKRRVAYKDLNGFPCVVMPFFRPLMKEEREQALDEIESCLMSFKDLKYHDDDIRWRHAGKFSDPIAKQEKIVLYDLADLEDVDEKDFSKVVAAQMKILKDRLPSQNTIAADE